VPFSGIASPDTGLALRLPPVVGFGTAFAFGWWLGPRRELLGVWQGRWALHVVVAAALTAFCYALLKGSGEAPMAAAPKIARSSARS
jgi:glucan biosynthesis protein C